MAFNINYRDPTTDDYYENAYAKITGFIGDENNVNIQVQMFKSKMDSFRLRTPLRIESYYAGMSTLRTDISFLDSMYDWLKNNVEMFKDATENTEVITPPQ